MGEQIRIDQPNTLLTKAYDVLKKVGAVKFMHGAGDELQKAREAFFAYFFILTFRRATKRDWWIVQPEKFPDLQLISYGESAVEMHGAEFEIVSIPPHISSINKMVDIVNAKFEKGYAPSRPLGLLVLPNNTKSGQFVEELNRRLGSIEPFSEVWVTYLVFKDETTIEKFITVALRPLPAAKIEVDFNDSNIYHNQKQPPMTETVTENGVSFMRFKPEYKNILQKAALKKRLGKQ